MMIASNRQLFKKKNKWIAVPIPEKNFKTNNLFLLS